MKNYHLNNQDVTRLFLKHSEVLLSSESENEQSGVLNFLRAMNEILAEDQMAYLVDKSRYSLENGDLITESIAEGEEQPQREKKILLFRLGEEEVEHFFLLSGPMPNDERKRYFDLLLSHYVTLFRDDEGPLPKIKKNNESLFYGDILRPSPLERSTGRIRAKYRQQKSIILSIENYTRKKRPPEVLAPPEISETKPENLVENPELEQEIIDLQNQLLEELNEYKEKVQRQSESYQTIINFNALLLDELTQRLTGIQETLNLFSTDIYEQNDHLRLLRELIRDKVLSYKNYLDILTETTEHDLTPEGVAIKKYNCLGLFHEAMGKYTDGNDGKPMVFELYPELEDFWVKVDKALMTKFLKALFELFFQVNQLEDGGKENVAVLAFRALQDQDSVELSMTLEKAEFPGELLELFCQLENLYDSIHSDYRSLAIYCCFLNTIAEKNEGLLSFKTDKKGDLICLLRLPGQRL